MNPMPPAAITLIASSGDGNSLTTALGERIVSRLSEDTRVIAVTGTDRRRGAAA